MILKPNSQNSRIIRELCVNDNLTAMEIIELCGTTNPRARIAELRKWHRIDNVPVTRGDKTLTGFKLVRPE